VHPVLDILRISRVAMIALAASIGALPSMAQSSASGAQDSVFRRAQRLASDGNASGARALVDSVLAASAEGSVQYTDALFWRASLAESVDQARRDYLRLAVDFPLSLRAEDALLRLAQIELARGDRTAARKHLDHLMLEHPNGRSRPEAAYWMGRVLLDEGAMAAACASLADARDRVPDSAVELSNQINYYARQCVNVQRAFGATPNDSTTRADSTARMTHAAGNPSRGEGTSRSAAKPPLRGPTWSVQVAAYSTKTDADQLAQQLNSRGYTARVTSDLPFRVRIGRFAKHSDALLLMRKLKDAKMTAIVVEAERP
jgi:cell division septation protein DedD